MKIYTNFNGIEIYTGFSLDTPPTRLDRQVVANTLVHKEFIAQMGDDYSVTQAELAAIARYRKTYGFIHE